MIIVVYALNAALLVMTLTASMLIDLAENLNLNFVCIIPIKSFFSFHGKNYLMKIPDRADPDYSLLKQRIKGLRLSVLQGKANPCVIMFAFTNMAMDLSILLYSHLTYRYIRKNGHCCFDRLSYDACEFLHTTTPEI